MVMQSAVSGCSTRTASPLGIISSDMAFWGVRFISWRGPPAWTSRKQDSYACRLEVGSLDKSPQKLSPNTTVLPGNYTGWSINLEDLWAFLGMRSD